MNVSLVSEPVHLIALHWRHNRRDGVSIHRRLDCLLSCLFRCRSAKSSKLRVTGLCEGNPPVTGGLASNAENVSIWWRHHGHSWTSCHLLGEGIVATTLCMQQHLQNTCSVVYDCNCRSQPLVTLLGTILYMIVMYWTFRQPESLSSSWLIWVVRDNLCGPLWMSHSSTNE